uniref:inositol-phosphate phosphatase n=2 Tax=Panagrellus redivivus TaxID=6233 RepID=A0A7E4W6I2_PANRE
MQIHPNLANIAKVLVGLFFVYLLIAIFSAKNAMPDAYVELRDVMSYAVLAVEMGGHAVKKIHEEQGLNIEEKGQTDVGKAELLTTADLVSNHLMLGLLERFPGLTAITEEKAEDLPDKDVERYREDNYALWLEFHKILETLPSAKYPLHRINVWVDPLDATQEYTEGLTQYVTTMACVTIDGKAVFGAIYRPFDNETVLGLVDWGVYSTRSGKIDYSDFPPAPKKVMVSRSHAGKVKEFVKEALSDEYEIIPAGGAGYKILNLINNTAEFYVHTTAIKKWDLCAADAIIRAAGGAMIDLEGSPISYWSTSDPISRNGLLTARKGVYQAFNKLKPFLKPTGKQ